MKFALISILLVMFLPSVLNKEKEPSKNETSVPTGIMLDSLGNEVMLLLKDGKPDHYYANIFTPVCNTGKCLPVYINFYWNLQGQFLRYDQDEGQILTKNDHEPFTENDYALLQEILESGEDPRTSEGLIKHQSVSHGSQGSQGSMSSPAPAAVVMVSKYDMVDGVSGSTLPEIRDKFVPGALYTTYTLWGLAHDKYLQMSNYTNSKLIIPENFEYFLQHTDYFFREKVVGLLRENGDDTKSHAEVCVSILDTSSNLAVQRMIINNFSSSEMQFDPVQEGFWKEFSETEHDGLKQDILLKLTYSYISEDNYLNVIRSLKDNQTIMRSYKQLLQTKLEWPESVFDELCAQILELNADNQHFIIDIMSGKKAYLKHDQIKRLKELEKEFKK